MSYSQLINTLDEQLLQQWRNGDNTAYDSLFKRYYTPLLSYAQKNIRDEMVAEELVMDVMLLAYSNFDIRHRVVSTISYNHNWVKTGKTNISLYFSAQSGSPFTYGIVNNSIQGLPQQVSLAYIPTQAEAINYFKDIPQGQTAIQQAQAFNTFINQNDYLSGRRGKFTERNAARTPLEHTGRPAPGA